jgi:hypothetical protein
MSTNTVVSLETMAKLRAARPVVTVPSYEAVQMVVKAIKMLSAGSSPERDVNGVQYWRVALADVVAVVNNPVMSAKLAGTCCRVCQLPMKRENDGFKVAWSQAQLDILTELFLK